MKREIGILYTFNGLSMLILWPLLIINHQAPEIQTNIVYMCFHLVSEFITAVFSLIAGIGLISKKNWADKLYYSATGLFIGAGYLAIGYYIFSDLVTALPVLLMLIGLNTMGIVFYFIDLQRNIVSTQLKKIKVFDFFNGISIYTLINVAGFLAEMKSGYTYGYVSMVLILILFSFRNLVTGFKKELLHKN